MTSYTQSMGWRHNHETFDVENFFCSKNKSLLLPPNQYIHLFKFFYCSRYICSYVWINHPSEYLGPSGFIHCQLLWPHTTHIERVARVPYTWWSLHRVKHWQVHEQVSWDHGCKLSMWNWLVWPSSHARFRLWRWFGLWCQCQFESFGLNGARYLAL